jgi:hypothetical protein
VSARNYDLSYHPRAMVSRDCGSYAPWAVAAVSSIHCKRVDDHDHQVTTGVVQPRRNRPALSSSRHHRMTNCARSYVDFQLERLGKAPLVVSLSSTAWVSSTIGYQSDYQLSLTFADFPKPRCGLSVRATRHRFVHNLTLDCIVSLWGGKVACLIERVRASDLARA